MNPCGTPENLRSLSDRSTVEQRKIASRGGKASGISRRKKAELRGELDTLLNHHGVATKICLALIDKAMQGDVRAFEVIRDTVEGKPDKRMNVVDHDGNTIDFVLTVVE